MSLRLKGRLPTTVLTAAACLAVLTVLPVSNAAAGPGGTAASAVAQSFEVTATLDGRTAKGLTNHAFPNLYIAGQYVPISCQASGAAAYGSTVWDLTKDHLWIPDYYVRTGSTGFSSAIVRCGSQPTSSAGGFDYTISATLDGRTAKDTTNHAYPNKYPAGSTVTITCQAYGGATYAGSYLWDKTAAGLWIVDYYVETGTTGLVSGIPRCDNDQPAGAPAPPAPGVANTTPSTQQAQISAAIAAARKATVDYPLYAYGGGHGSTPGPTRGFCDGVNGYDDSGTCVASSRVGFDCSGLMRWAFYRGTGIDFGSGSTTTLYDRMPGMFGSRVSRPMDLQPGDLVLARWEGSSPGHTYIISATQPAQGSVTLIEAPRTTIPLREITRSYADLLFVVGYRLK
jgi:cell wall-associated NlpC family hydrolase